MKTVITEPMKNKIGVDMESCSRLSELGTDVPLISLLWSEVSVKFKGENFQDQ